MKPYIKPETTQHKVHYSVSLLAGSPEIDPNQKVDNPSLFDSREFRFFEEEEIEEEF